ncbi:MAG: isoleucine--tRNA ligase [Kiloniellales bacterium]
MTSDYRSTLLLPRTDFAMKADLPKREPQILARWQKMDLFSRLRAAAKGREKFILHDGPPYANGHLHIGTALNKILKDIVNRSQQMLGKDANYVPGWDCHGLPIEWKIEETYRAAGKDKDRVDIIQFRRECREFADHWIDVQRNEFKRLGVEGNWTDPYSTMAFAAEAQIAREIGKFLMDGGLYRGAKPVLWSVVEKTALAEAEVEYRQHRSTTVLVRFPVVKAASGALDGASVVIWTTTPWTLPGNRAIAFSRDLDYAVYEVRAVAEGSLAVPGERLVLCRSLADQVKAEAGITEWTAQDDATGLAGTVCRHPLRGRGYDFDVPVTPGGFVTADQGTGFVHVAPGHGAEDFDHGQALGLETPRTVGEDGSFYDEVPLFAGTVVYTADGKPGDANRAVIAALKQAGALLAQGSLTHEYPHSWRSKAPLIFRNTEQWFISMTANDLRRKALAAIDRTRFYPPAGRKRLYGMIESRPDWCVSRQRAWGVPIPVFVDKQSGQPLRDQAVVDRIAEVFEAEGADAWFTSPPARFLGPAYDPDRFEQVRDVVDVWFDSGATHSFVLEARPDQKWPASLYLEGSDQHRGWFHSSLLEACGTRGVAPYEAVLTHGFVVDQHGRKMSKSLGNVVSPQEVIETLGADILRLWVVASDYTEDLRIGPDILKHQVEAYRRLRNTLRFLLGNLPGDHPAEPPALQEMPELERWILHRLWQLDQVVRGASERFDFHTLYTQLHGFCALELSAFYFDVRKDCLYCDRAAAPRRRAAVMVLERLFSCLTAWLAPILCFTAEEAWRARAAADAADSVHLRLFPEVPEAWRDEALDEKWQQVRALRRVVTGALEIAREGKRIGSSLQAHPIVYADPAYASALENLDLAEIAITSDATLSRQAAPEDAFRLDDVDGVAVVVGAAQGSKCQRCWKVLPEVGSHGSFPDICKRCAEAVEAVGLAAD